MAPRASPAAPCARAVTLNFGAANAYAAAAPPDCNNKRRLTLGVRNTAISDRAATGFRGNAANYMTARLSVSWAALKLLLHRNAAAYGRAPNGMDRRCSPQYPSVERGAHPSKEPGHASPL